MDKYKPFWSFYHLYLSGGGFLVYFISMPIVSTRCESKRLSMLYTSIQLFQLQKYMNPKFEWLTEIPSFNIQ